MLAYNFLFCRVFAWFWHQGNGGFIECIGSVSFPFKLMELLEKHGYDLSFICLVKFPCEAVWSWTFVFWEVFACLFLFNYKFNSLLVISLFRFYFFLIRVEDCMFLETCQFFLGFPIYWHITLYSLRIVCLWYWLLFILPYSSCFIFLGLLYFFLNEPE